MYKFASPHRRDKNYRRREKQETPSMVFIILMHASVTKETNEGPWKKWCCDKRDKWGPLEEDCWDKRDRWEPLEERQLWQKWPFKDPEERNKTPIKVFIILVHAAWQKRQFRALNSLLYHIKDFLPGALICLFCHGSLHKNNKDRILGVSFFSRGPLAKKTHKISRSNLLWQKRQFMTTGGYSYACWCDKRDI